LDFLNNKTIYSYFEKSRSYNIIVNLSLCKNLFVKFLLLLLLPVVVVMVRVRGRVRVRVIAKNFSNFDSTSK